MREGTRGSVVAIIPARGGSKRIPRKNIRPFLGEPMISRILTTVLSSGLFDRVFVSTDDDEIAAVAQSKGAEVPHLRPPHLSDDLATTAQVIDWELSQLRKFEPQISTVCTVYPTAVFTTGDHLRESLSVFRAGAFDLVFAGIKHSSPIWRAYVRSDDNSAVMLWDEYYMKRTQDLPATYFDAGQFYWSTDSCWSRILKDGTPNTSRIGIYPIQPGDAVDIDDEDDWALAEQLFTLKKLK